VSFRASSSAISRCLRDCPHGRCESPFPRTLPSLGCASSRTSRSNCGSPCAGTSGTISNGTSNNDVADLWRQDDERARRAELRQFSGAGFSALYTRWLAQGDDVFASVSLPVHLALFSEIAIIEPLVLPHGYSHLAPLVGVA
jgi:hypothetical protein